MPTDTPLHCRLSVIVCVLGMFCGGVRGAGDAATRPATAVSDSDLDAALDKANAANGKDRDAPLVSVASRFQSVDVCTTAGRNMWSIRTLNERGKGIDAVRFTVPDGMTTHLYWAFSVANLKEWYIVPLNGKLTGFEDFIPNQKYRLPAVFNQHLILQDLPTRLTAGEDYLLWFKIDGNQPVQAYMSIVLLDDDRPGTAAVIEAAIGLRKQMKQKAKP
jgi:hypothetical protein